MSDFSKFKISIEEYEEPWDEIIDELDDTEILKIDEEINDKYLEESAWFFFLLFSTPFQKKEVREKRERKGFILFSFLLTFFF